MLVIASAAGDEVASHLVNELIAMGITAIVTPALEGELATLAREKRASAAVRVLSSRKSVRAWVDPTKTSSPDSATAEELIEEKPGDRDDPAASLALRTVEILRARLMTIPVNQNRPAQAPRPSPEAPSEEPPAAAPPHQPSAETPEPAPSATHPHAQAPPPKRSNWATSLYIAPAFVAHPGSGLSAGGGTLGGVTLMFSKQFGGDFMVIAPVAASTVSSAAGTIKISSTSIGIGGWLNVLNVPKPFTLGAGAGLALGFLAFDGEASDPIFQGRDGTVPYALPYARAAVTWRALPPLGLRADFLAGIAIPRPVIQAEGSAETAVFGRPMLVMSLGVEMAFF